MYDETIRYCKIFKGPVEELYDDCFELGFSSNPSVAECKTAVDPVNNDQCDVNFYIYIRYSYRKQFFSLQCLHILQQFVEVVSIPVPRQEFVCSLPWTWHCSPARTCPTCHGYSCWSSWCSSTPNLRQSGGLSVCSIIQSALDRVSQPQPSSWICPSPLVMESMRS